MIKKLILYFLRTILLAMSLFLVYKADYLFAFSAFMAAVISFIPLLSKRYNLKLPWILEFLIAFALVLHIVGGEYYNFYKISYIFSPIMHFLGTAIIALFAYMVVYALKLSKHIKVSILMIGIFTLAFSLAIGTFWEICEFAADRYLGTNSQGDGINPLDDTMYDLMWDGLAGLVVAIIGSSLAKGHHGLVHPFERFFLRIKRKYRNYRIKLKKKEIVK